MGEFASKGVAGSGLGLGIAGTALGVLNASNCGGGLLGGLFGGNCQQGQVSALQAEVSQLRAEKYSDKNSADVYSAMRNEVAALNANLLEKWITPLSDEAARNRERVAVLETSVKYENEKALLREQNVRLELKGYVDDCCCRTNGRINDLDHRTRGLARTLDSITSVVVPRTAICPEVMPRFNSWVAPTAEAPANQPVVGNIDLD